MNQGGAFLSLSRTLLNGSPVPAVTEDCSGVQCLCMRVCIDAVSGIDLMEK